jgi:hypothetical protein
VEFYLSKSCTKHIQSLSTNHPYDLCDAYDYYSHHYPNLTQSQDALAIVCGTNSSLADKPSPILDNVSIQHHFFFKKRAIQLLKSDLFLRNLMRIFSTYLTFQLPWDHYLLKTL